MLHAGLARVSWVTAALCCTLSVGREAPATYERLPPLLGGGETNLTDLSGISSLFTVRELLAYELLDGCLLDN
jgi:hypothetical protein